MFLFYFFNFLYLITASEEPKLVQKINKTINASVIREGIKILLKKEIVKSIITKKKINLQNIKKIEYIIWYSTILENDLKYGDSVDGNVDNKEVEESILVHFSEKEIQKLRNFENRIKEMHTSLGSKILNFAKRKIRGEKKQTVTSNDKLPINKQNKSMVTFDKVHMFPLHKEEDDLEYWETLYPTHFCKKPQIKNILYKTTKVDDSTVTDVINIENYKALDKNQCVALRAGAKLLADTNK